MNKNKIINVFYKREIAVGNRKLEIAYIENYKITDVVVTRNSLNEWIVTLKLSGDLGTLYTKRNRLRTFSKLESAANYLKMLGVDTFTVDQYDQRTLF
ncbi:hypothetical protein Nit79A3_1499 [Nitrosomonas sp. Is79A3]